MKVGDPAVFVDRAGKNRPAVITAVFGKEGGGEPSVNLVYVSDDPNKSDTYGRQIKRDTSVPHRSAQPAPGYCWMTLKEWLDMGGLLMDVVQDRMPNEVIGESA